MTDTVGFAEGLTPDQRETLHTLARPVSFPPGHRLFDEGQIADRFWILSRGSVALDIQVPGRPAPVIETLGQGDLLGWSWLFEPYRWHLGARALAPVDAKEFDASAVRAACERDTGFGYVVARAVAAVVGQRLRATRMRLLDLYGPPHGGVR
ncbi:cyclic nucleotide-binding domain-containing protein [Streptomyces sp. SudanB182_2057]|uniref:cyclic nucleotide-binding domain-containing protein n=1 Tax=Streptomyces sp. SudanB182_2057 TaxID=3035281 RepID=UPI003F577344